MNRDGYEFLECLGHVEERFIDQAGQPWEKEKEKHIRYPGMKAACVSLILLLGVGVIFRQQVEAAIGQMKTRIADWLFVEKDLSPYTEVIDEEQVVNGVSMTLKEVILDSNKVMAAVEVEKKDGEQAPASVFLNGVKLNGEWLESFAGTTADLEPLYEENAKVQGYYLDYMVAEETMPDKISSVELRIQYAEPGEEKGSWESRAEFSFRFGATKEELSGKRYEIPLDCEIDAGNGLVFHFKEITCSNVTSRIRAVCDGEPRTFGEFNGEPIESADYMLDIVTDEGKYSSYMATAYDAETKEMIFDSMDSDPPREGCTSLEINLKRLRPLKEDVFMEDLLKKDGQTEMEITNEELPEELGTVKIHPEDKEYEKE